MNMSRLIKAVTLNVLMIHFLFGAGLWAGSQNLPRMSETFPKFTEGIYTNKYTYFPGDEIQFHVFVKRDFFSPSIEVLDLRKRIWKAVHEFTKIKAPEIGQPFRHCSASDGCRWANPIRFTIPRNWNSGIYRFVFQNSHSEKRIGHFIIATKDPQNSLLYFVDFQTPCAYNLYGNASFYSTILNDGTWISSGSNSYSCRRPLVVGSKKKDGKAHLYQPKIEKLPWIWTPQFLLDISEKVEMDFAAIEPATPKKKELLKQYEAIVLNGSLEYLSQVQISPFKHYVTGGGKLIMNAREYGYGMVELDSQNGKMKFIGNRHTLLSLEAIHDFFGFALTPPRWINTSSHNEFVPVKVIDARHPIFNGLNLVAGDILFESGAVGVGGEVITDQSTEKLCLFGKNVNCENSIVLAEGKWKNEKSNSSIVIALVRQGKGYIFTAPGIYFSTSEIHTMKKLRQRIVPFMLKLDKSDNPFTVPG